jgi:hypothetical protein
MKEMLTAATSLPKKHVADDFNLKLLNRIYAEQNHPTESYLPVEPPTIWQRPLAWLSAAATVAACALVAIVFFGSRTELPPQIDQPQHLIASNTPATQDFGVRHAHRQIPMSVYENLIGVSGQRSSYRATNLSNARSLRVASDARVESLYVDWLRRLGQPDPTMAFVRQADHRLKFGSRGLEPGFRPMNAGVVRTSYTR